MSAEGAAPILVLGFGAFLDVVDNPSSRLARAVHGAVVAGHPVVGAEMPVDYEGCMALTRRMVDELQPAVVLGIGVAVGRSRPELERFGRRVETAGRPDVGGQVCAPEVHGAPECLEARLPVEAMARSMGAGTSEDAGRYVCNSWLLQALHHLGDVAAVGFLHVPPEGLEPARLLAGLQAAVVDERGTSPLG